MKKHTTKLFALAAAMLIATGCGGGRQTADTTAAQGDEEAAVCDRESRRCYLHGG